MTMTVVRPGEWAREGACTAPDVKATWWEHSAGKRGRRVAARLCGACPVLQQCDEYRRQLGTAAEGTYAGVFQPYTGASVYSEDSEIDEIAAAMDWEGRHGRLLSAAAS